MEVLKFLILLLFAATVDWSEAGLPSLRQGSSLKVEEESDFLVSPNGTFSSVEARLLETGNLVLINQEKRVIWQSFDSPTDTLLPSQRLVKNTTLVSVRSQGTYLSGFYNFKFDDNNVLYLVYNGPLLSSVYWPKTSSVYWPKTDGTVFDSGRTPYNSSRLAISDKAGQFISSDNLMFNASDYGIGPKRRLTMDYDGILRLYSLDESTGVWVLKSLEIQE
ncbi:unnamed protein product [Prunus armeniaca]|uniref:Bulb-type lectin domain-containing protein n=1 Tax=Prunus armeniaca TaxID=36596 RepID=A0A6J5VFC4_PRUAR|nr:unnamed protein product [Prunus armeniaca]